MVDALELWPTLLAGPLGATTPIAELHRLRPKSFNARAEAILAAQAVAWSGLWEVQALVPGRGFSARDLLTHEERFVSDVAASRSARERAILCARVVTSGEDSWLSAADERVLGPREGDEVRRLACERFDWPKTKAVPTWPDVPLPALDGTTPRQAVTTKRGRAQVERLLADLEHHEQSDPPAARYDVDILRTALGLPPSRVHPGVPRH